MKLSNYHLECLVKYRKYIKRVQLSRAVAEKKELLLNDFPSWKGHHAKVVEGTMAENSPADPENTAASNSAL